MFSGFLQGLLFVIAFEKLTAFTILSTLSRLSTLSKVATSDREMPFSSANEKVSATGRGVDLPVDPMTS